MALIPPAFLDAVVALGVPGPTTRWVGTGWIYLAVEERTEATAYGQTFLVTNRHVVEPYVELNIRCNPHGYGPAQEFELGLLRPDGGRLWSAHPDDDADVAVVPIRFDMLREAGMAVSVIHSDRHAARNSELIELGVSEGDGTFVLGFPMGMVGEGRNAVTVRGGTIARIGDLLRETSNEFLVDAFVFPGNSGGPVVLRPQMMSIKGTKSVTRAVVIGIVKSYVPYQDVAVSSQTNRPRVIFEENTGLAAAHSIDAVDAAIAQYRLELRTSEPAPEDEAQTIPDAQNISGAPGSADVS